jgi:hypothetical protein
MVLDDHLFAVFALCERKNRKYKKNEVPLCRPS